MASTEWFRTRDWDRDARADFEARLARARDYNRPQYLRIKALMLRDADDKQAAADLLKRVLDEYSDSFDGAFCAELLGAWAAESSDWQTAEKWYRRSLHLRPDQGGTTSEVHIGLAEALVAQHRHAEAVETLNAFPIEQLTLNHAVCRWNAALADAAQGLGEERVAADAANRALGLLDALDQFSRHPGVGRAVLMAGQEARLRRMVQGTAPTVGTRRGLFGKRR